MRKKTPQAPRLRLHRETLRRLQTADLARAAGGIPTGLPECVSKAETYCGEFTCGQCPYPNETLDPGCA